LTDTPALRKARGAFFTPPEMSDFIASWAIRSPGDRVLEPSCGEASFLLAAGRRLRALGASRAELHGVELHEASARGAREVIESHAFAAGITVADFFDVPPAPMYDAAIGNPPYVRYQHFTGLARAKGLQAALAQGVRLTGLASAWAAFVIHAAQFLKPSGRLGLVLPAELLTVNYAAQVRHFLLNRFASVRLVMFDELVFPGVLEEVVLLLAEGTGGAAKFELFHARDLADLRRIDRDVWTDYAPDGEGKWTPALLSTEAVETYHVIAQEEGFSPLLEWGDTYLGAVTGNNRYFTLTQAQAIEHGFWRSELLRISPPGSRHLRGLTFSDKAWAEQAQSGARCYLFAPMIGADVSPAAERHIESGEAAGVNAA
jgi:adenine-specific DNA-methyltransferase